MAPMTCVANGNRFAGDQARGAATWDFPQAHSTGRSQQLL